LKVENHDHCVYDYVEVRDGHEDSSRLLGKFCGHRMPSDVKSTTNRMYVKFVSDASVQKGGFAAVFVKGQVITGSIRAVGGRGQSGFGLQKRNQSKFVQSAGFRILLLHMHCASKMH